MVARELSVARRAARPPARSRGLAAVSAFALAAALVGFVFRPAPGPVERDPFAYARETLDRMLVEGTTSADVRDRMRRFRARLGRAPLDSRTRGAYSALVLFGGVGPAAMEAASFHALLAAEYAPVTVPVVRRAAFVLVESRRYDEALDLVRDMYGYDAEAASGVLATLRPFVDPDRLRNGLPDAPDAWRSWADRLARDGRPEESVATLESGLERWPDDLGLLTALALRRTRTRDAAGLLSLLGPREIPGGSDSALLRVLRAQALAWNGDDVAARADLESAYGDAPDDLDVLRHGGDVWDALDEPDRARRWWNRGRFLVPSSNPAGQAPFASRVALMEDRRGRPVEALRAWRVVLSLDPDNEFARKRIRELGTGSP